MSEAKLEKHKCFTCLCVFVYRWKRSSKSTGTKTREKNRGGESFSLFCAVCVGWKAPFRLPLYVFQKTSVQTSNKGGERFRFKPRDGLLSLPTFLGWARGQNKPRRLVLSQNLSPFCSFHPQPRHAPHPPPTPILESEQNIWRRVGSLPAFCTMEDKRNSPKAGLSKSRVKTEATGL